MSPTPVAYSESQRRTVYRIGALCTMVVLAGIVADIVIGSITGGDLAALPQTATGRFDQLQRSPWLGLYNLDLLNVIIQLLLLPGYYALTIAHRDTRKALAGLALLLFAVGTTIFVINNSALVMLDLSNKYASAFTEAQKSLYAAAGEAMLAKGVHAGFNVFPGFLLPNIGGFVMSLVMLRGEIFGRVTAYSGAAGSILISVYVVLVTFMPGAASMATALAAPGGILLMLWMLLFTRRLLKLAGTASAA